LNPRPPPSSMPRRGGTQGLSIRHARARPGHPRLTLDVAAKTWMAGTSPAMTADLRRSLSLAQSLPPQPLLNPLGTLCVVPVHHQHVRIAMHAAVGKIDDVDAAAGGFEHAGILDAARADLRPARMILGVVAIDDQHRRVLEQPHLVLVAAQGRLD